METLAYPRQLYLAWLRHAAAKNSPGGRLSTQRGPLYKLVVYIISKHNFFDGSSVVHQNRQAGQIYLWMARTSAYSTAFLQPSYSLLTAYHSLPHPTYSLPQAAFSLPQPTIAHLQPLHSLPQP